jgi:hypothetical protein
MRALTGRSRAEIPDYRHLRLLRARRVRPRRRAAEHCDELAPFHSVSPSRLLTERIAHLSMARDCCTAAFQSPLFRLRVKSGVLSAGRMSASASSGHADIIKAVAVASAVAIGIGSRPAQAAHTEQTTGRQDQGRSGQIRSQRWCS